MAWAGGRRQSVCERPESEEKEDQPNYSTPRTVASRVVSKISGKRVIMVVVVMMKRNEPP
jgi:protein tyrosine phosphatase (PTP) superfamily phosphohydrolase (DUF442 family)